MQSCLEMRSMDARHEQEVRSDYQRSSNEYSSIHPDALATGDEQGKGTGHGGHGFWLPDCNAQINVFNFSNFDTGYDSGNGSETMPNTDKWARKQSVVRSMYNYEHPYHSVDTSANVAEGQYVCR